MEEDVKTSNFYMYFGDAEEKCCEKPQMFGRTEGDYITIMPPIKLKTILKPTIVFLILLITIVSPYRVPNDTSLYQCINRSLHSL